MQLQDTQKLLSVTACDIMWLITYVLWNWTVYGIYYIYIYNDYLFDSLAVGKNGEYTWPRENLGDSSEPRRMTWTKSLVWVLQPMKLWCSDARCVIELKTSLVVKPHDTWWVLQELLYSYLPLRIGADALASLGLIVDCKHRRLLTDDGCGAEDFCAAQW